MEIRNCRVTGIEALGMYSKPHNRYMSKEKGSPSGSAM